MAAHVKAECYDVTDTGGTWRHPISETTLLYKGRLPMQGQMVVKNGNTDVVALSVQMGSDGAVVNAIEDVYETVDDHEGFLRFYSGSVDYYQCRFELIRE